MVARGSFGLLMERCHREGREREERGRVKTGRENIYLKKVKKKYKKKRLGRD